MASVLLIVTILLSLQGTTLCHSITGDCNTFEIEKTNEGYYPCVHTDPTTGTSRLGVGFDLYYYFALDDLKQVGANMTKILNKTQCLTDDQIRKLFKISMDRAEQCVSSWMYKAWSPLSVNAKSALIDMGFDYHYIGCYPTLEDFVDLKNALTMTPPDYDKAATILEHSTWCGQENTRCMRAAKCFQSNS